MLSLYTLLIGHKCCNMLSILNKLILQAIQTFGQILCFETKKFKHNNNKTKNQTQKLLPEPAIDLGTSSTQSGTSTRRCQLRVTIVVKLFNCFDALCQYVNKQS